jgi:hypothetical protein
MREDENKILNVLTAFSDAWIGVIKPDEILSLWDSELDDPTYLAVERDEFIRGHASIRDYYVDVSRRMGYVVSRGDLLHPIIHVLEGGTLAHVSCSYRWAWKVGPHEGVTVSRVSVVMRKRAERWRFLHMHESIKWTPPVS